MASRQYAWQQKMKAAGRCIVCGSFHLLTANHCMEHTKTARKRSFIQARKRSGIPLDAPLTGRGRHRAELKEEKKNDEIVMVEDSSPFDMFYEAFTNH